MSNSYEILTITQPQSAYAEAFRKLQVSLQYLLLNEKKVIQVVSSLARDGKTLTCLNLAAAYAEKGKKVAIIDLDLRKPKIHYGFNLVNEKGFVEVISGEAKLEDVIQKTDYGIDVILRGQSIPRPEVLLESKLCDDLLEKIKGLYDIIILDCPPILAVTDSLIISRLSDAVLFVVAHKKTKKDSVKESIKLLKSVNANICGIVLSQVNTKYMNFNSVYRRYADYNYYTTE